MKLLITVNYFCVLLLVTIVSCSRHHFSDNFKMDMYDEAEESDSNEVTCFCNLPICVTTSYMCKTSNKKGGGCFTDVSISVPFQRAAHGCLDLLDSSSHAQCHNEPSVTRANKELRKINSDSSGNDVAEVPGSSTRSSSVVSSLLLCCYEDMCNHIDNPENHIKYNDSVMAAVLAGTKMTNLNLQVMVPSESSKSPYDNNEVWFRAATIAVPICGALILFILITLAMKILRSDIEDAKNGKFRSKNGAILPSYTPIHFNSATRMSGYPNPINTNIKEMKNICDFTNNDSGNDMKQATNKIPLLYNYQHDEMKNEQPNLQHYEQNVNIVNECNINCNKTNKIMYSDNTLKSDKKNKLNCIVNNKLKE